MAKAETGYVRNEISKNMNNPRKLWKTLKRIAPTKSAPSNFSFIETEDKSVYDPTEMAKTFNKHFTNIQQNADTVIPVVDTNKQNHRLTDFVESRINNSTVFLTSRQLVWNRWLMILRTFLIIKPQDLMESELNP